MGILKRFYPDCIYPTVHDIEADFFAKRDIKYALLDIDNTLVPYTVELPTARAREFLARLKKEGIKYCFISNNSGERVKLFADEVGERYVAKAKKPRLSGLWRAMEIIGAEPEKTVLIGDQIFTDVYTGKRAGLKTVLVSPIEDKETPFFKFKRAMERIVLKSYRKGY